MTVETDTVGQQNAEITSRLDGAMLRVILSGPWTVTTIGAVEDAVDALCRADDRPTRVEIDFSRVKRLDTGGGALADRIARAYVARGADVVSVGMPEQAKKLYAEVHDSLAAPDPEKRAERIFIARALAKVGRETKGAGQDMVALLAILGDTLSAFARVVIGRGRFRLAAVVTQFERVCFRAVPIIVLITFLIGGIVAQQGIFFFRRFGADSFVVDLVGILTMRELGVLLVAIMIAGRSGSAFTAELGSMKMREEIDALRVMGMSPIEVLVLPRVLALVIGLPILTFIGNMSALTGGALVAQVYGDMPWDVFFERLQESVAQRHLWVGLAKAPFMALVIGLIACVEGLRVGGSAESLGQHVTAAVVKAIFMVIVLDGLFAMFFAALDV